MPDHLSNHGWTGKVVLPNRNSWVARPKFREPQDVRSFWCQEITHHTPPPIRWWTRYGWKIQSFYNYYYCRCCVHVETKENWAFHWCCICIPHSSTHFNRLLANVWQGTHPFRIWRPLPIKPRPPHVVLAPCSARTQIFSHLGITYYGYITETYLDCSYKILTSHRSLAKEVTKKHR